MMKRFLGGGLLLSAVFLATGCTCCGHGWCKHGATASASPCCPPPAPPCCPPPAPPCCPPGGGIAPPVTSGYAPPVVAIPAH
jgi:hypothetical protein